MVLLETHLIMRLVATFFAAAAALFAIPCGNNPEGSTTDKDSLILTSTISFGRTG